MRGVRTLFLVFAVLAGTFSASLVSPPTAAWSNVSVYMSGLDFPIALAFASDGRIFFAERFTGGIRIIENGSLLQERFYTLTNTTGDGERGLLGLALDPEFPTSPYVYAYQTFDDGPNGIVNRVVRIRAEGNTGVSHTEIFRTDPLSAATNHNGGVIGFGPDDKQLYALVGENAWPPLAQDPVNSMGKVLRMTRDGWAPPDNPFVNDPRWFNLTYSYGHRNMFGLAFHPISKGIFVTENGPECNDEVNLLIAGGNFGWGPLSANGCGPSPDVNATNQDGPDPVLPVHWWHETICATNAAIHNGPGFPAWRGDLFMGDCKTGTLRRLDLSSDYTRVESDEPIYVVPDAIIDVEAGPDGAIWFTTTNTIYRLWDSGVPPVADFTANPNPVVVGTPVQFNASASYDPDGTIVSYAWDFGDGNRTESGPTPSYVYRAPGRFIVNLTVTDNESYASMASREVTVNALLPPQARFTFQPSPVAPGVPVTFNASTSIDPDGESIVTYEWEFGDGTEDTGVVATHAYAAKGAYAVNLTVTDSDNLTNTTTQTVFVGQPPRAAIDVSPATIYINTPVHFSGTGSTDDVMIVNWTWNFGDETEGWGLQTIHWYTEKGRFTVALTVKDDDGLTNSTSTVVEVRNRPPAITSTTPAAGPVSLAPGDRLTFSVDASDPDEDPLSYAWRVDDTTRGTASAFTFVSPGPGVYKVNVTVSDGSSTVFREWTVTVGTIQASGPDVLFLGLVSVAIVLIGIGSAAAVVGWRRHRRKQKDQKGT